MHMVVAKVPTFSTKGILLRALSLLTLLVSLAAGIGSIEYVVQDLKVGTLFKLVIIPSALRDHAGPRLHN